MKISLALLCLLVSAAASASYCLKPVAIVEVTLPPQYAGVNLELVYHQQGDYGGLNRSEFTHGETTVAYAIPWTGHWSVSDGSGTASFDVTETESPCVPGYVPYVIQVTLSQ